MNLLNKGIAKLNRQYRYVLNDTRQLLGLNNEFFTTAKGAGIIAYHGVCLHNPTKFNSLFVGLKTFEKQLRFYKAHFNILSLNDFFERKFDEHKFNICLTFDDGFRNNLQYVLPLLEQYQIPATFFITGIRKYKYDILWNDFLTIGSYYGPSEIKYRDQIFRKNSQRKYVSEDQKQLSNIIRNGNFDLKREMFDSLSALATFKNNIEEHDFWLQMTEAEIQQLAQSAFVTVGSHGLYHNDLANIEIAAAKDELMISKEYLETITSKEIKALAFPYGSYSREIVDEAKRIGYQQIFPLDFRFPAIDSSDETMMERFGINPYISLPNQLLALINGHYE